MRAKINNKLIASVKPKEKPFEIRDSNVTGFILRVQPSGKMTYICQYARAKRINIGSATVLTPAQGRDQAIEILAKVSTGADPRASKLEKKAHNLESYILNVDAQWVEIHHRNGDATIKRIKANFFSTLGKCKLKDITRWNLEKWRSQRLKGGTQPATLNRDISDLKAALNRAVDWGFIDKNPITTIKPLKLDKTPNVRYLDASEEQRLRAALDARENQISEERASANQWRAERGYKLLPDLDEGFSDYLKPMVLLLINTGIRRGELFNLKWADVDIDRAMLTIKAGGTKTGQTRHIPLNLEAQDALRQWKIQSKEHGLVFPAKNGERFTNVNNSWRKLLRDAEIHNFRLHDLRHHFASRLVMVGVDLNTVRELLGHSDIKMTLRYAHLAPKVKAEAVQKLVRSNHS